ncbi:MAG: DUF1553 domain-containing protein [Aureliella sp.]
MKLGNPPLGRRFLGRILSLSCVTVLASTIVAQDQAQYPTFDVQFNRDVRPILSDRCFHCHGPDGASREADLRLDVPDDADVSGWNAVIDDSWEDSELWARITTDDADLQMPPPTAHKKPLSESERGIIAAWLQQGASYEKFWAFVPPVAVEPPDLPSGTSLTQWSKRPIDRFIARQLEEKGIEPKPRADRATLLRRLSLDLTGLPPTESEVDAFLADDSPGAYERQVDRLLASKRYGEHMAKYWLDLVRFADTNGIHHDHFRELTPFRDWVIRSFNNNYPYDKFSVEQIAGDLLPNPTQDQLVASGFNRLHLVIDKGTALPEESHTRNVIDRVTAVGTAFMGLTVGCAVCHDHKYDPITQRDFYRLYAFFNNIDATPETPGRGIHEPALRFPTPQQSEQMAALDRNIAELQRKIAAAKKNEKDATSDDEPTDAAKANDDELKSLQASLKQTQGKRSGIERGILTTLIMKEREEPRPAHILIRGAYDQPGEQVDRGVPAFLPPIDARGDQPDRLDLAKWLIREDHPLMSRVAVNRFWQQLFGVGLVRTSEDFGAQGEMPSHPQLLDYLATQFVSSGWDVKKLMRRMVMSSAYQQSSVASPDEYKADPQNRLLARGSRFRLDAEVIRDQSLYVAGLLNEDLYGRSVKPPQPPNLWKNVSMVSSSTYEFVPDEGEKIYRRSLYTFWKRALPPPQMTIFDAPTRESCIARRERTNTPLQALVLMNERLFFESAVRLAVLLTAEEKLSIEEALRSASRRITTDDPDAAEMRVMLESYQRLLEAYADDQQSAKDVLAANESASDIVPPDQVAQTAALALVINGLMNLDVTKTRQ